MSSLIMYILSGIVVSSVLIPNMIDSDNKIKERAMENQEFWKEHNEWKASFDEKCKLDEIKRDLKSFQSYSMFGLLYDELVENVKLNNNQLKFLDAWRDNKSVQTKVSNAILSLKEEGSYANLCGILSSVNFEKTIRNMRLSATGDCYKILSDLEKNLSAIDSNRTPDEKLVRKMISDVLCGPNNIEKFCYAYKIYNVLTESRYFKNLFNILLLMGRTPNYKQNLAFQKLCAPILFVSAIFIGIEDLFLTLVADKIHIQKEKVLTNADIYNQCINIAECFLFKHARLIDNLQTVSNSIGYQNSAYANSLTGALKESLSLDIYSVIFATINSKLGDNIFDSNKLNSLRALKSNLLNKIVSIRQQISSNIDHVNLNVDAERALADAETTLDFYKKCLNGTILEGTELKPVSSHTEGFNLIVSKL